VPFTYPPHTWLSEYVQEVYNDDTVHETYCKQLDAFAEHQGWERSDDEKRNRINEPGKDKFLQGVIALLQLIFYDVPAKEVSIS
jgi:hypothetical protein